MEWLSVKDILPESFSKVLVTDGNRVGIGYYDICDWVGSDEPNMLPIFWMQLPNPPNIGK